jgi:hypothetical protein
MAPEHESDPLVGPRSDESDVEAASGAGEPPAAPGESEPGSDPIEASEASSAVAEPSSAAGRSARRTGRRNRDQSPNMLPARHARGTLERTFVRVIATLGIVGIGVAIAAVMASSNSHGWVIGLVVSLVSVILAAVLWSSRVL